MAIKRQTIANIVTNWVGMKESDGSFKPIIDIYNTIDPLPQGYRLKYTDWWCAGTASAAYQMAEAADMFPCECSCARMITKAKAMGIWEENDSYLPKVADAILYDWQDSGDGDNEGTPDHVGIVVSVDKKSNTFVVVEGNKNNAVGTRTMSVNGKYIRGFVRPKFEEDNIQSNVITTQTVTIDGKVNTTTVVTQSSNTEVTSSLPASDAEASQATVIAAKVENDLVTGTLSKVPAGTKLNLKNTLMYASSSSNKSSSKKTGTYYIWSVDTVNSRVRITNSEKNVGKAGQVTGWITVKDAIAKAVIEKSQDITANVPTYQVNAVYVTQVSDLTVRKGPGTSYDKVGYAGLTANAKKHDLNKNGCLDAGTKVTCLEVKVVGSNVWIKIPSGWIAAYYDKKYYVK